MSARPVRTRIAPSPTGDPHVGTAYMGLINTVVARQHGGQFILRIDDTDRARFRAGSEEAVLEALRWLGLEWDEGPDKGGPKGPYRQSERTEIYREHAQRLIDAGKAYRCFCTKERLDALRAEQRARKEDPGYDRHCRALEPGEVERRLAAGEPFVVRFAVPIEGKTVVQDLLRGAIEFDHATMQDQVLLKADGFPTYHLASVVDDHLFEISHIIRAEEWLSSGPLHVLLFAAFGWEMPVICHMPLLRNADKSKISKRKNPTSILYYRDAGLLPEGLLNFLGLMGWGGPKQPDGSNREVFGVGDMVEHFRLEDLRLGGPVFDLDKLRHINSQHLWALPPDEYARRLEQFLFGGDRLRRVVDLVQIRTQTFGEFLDKSAFFFGDVSHYTPETRGAADPKAKKPLDGLVPKKRTPEETWFALAEAQAALERVSPWSAPELEAAARALATEEATGWKARDLFMTLRVAATGRTESPGLFETLEVLGRSRSLGRLSDAMRAVGEPSKKAQDRYEKAKRKRLEARSGEEQAGGAAPA